MLIKTLIEVQNSLPVSTGVTFEKIRPHLEVVERDFIRPLIGGNMFDELQEFYDSEITESLTEVQEAMQTLLKYVQGSEVHLCFWLGFDVLNAYISDGGFKRTETDKVKSLFKYQEDNLKNYFKITGFNALDVVLEYLEDNIQHFGEFKLSDTYKNLKTSFIPGTRIFDSIYFIGASRLTFLRLIQHMNTVEDLHIKKLLAENYEIIKTEMIKDEPEERVIDILPEIRKPIAFLSVAMLMEESGADLTDKGLYFESRIATNMSDTEKKPAEVERIRLLAERAKKLGESYLALLRQYLQDSADWGNIPAQSSYIHNRDNTGKKTFWA